MIGEIEVDNLKGVMDVRSSFLIMSESDGNTNTSGSCGSIINRLCPVYIQTITV